MPTLKDMVESILITEITRLYERAVMPGGLTVEEIRKLEVLVKIKEVENVEDTKNKKINRKQLSLDELEKIALKPDDHK